MTKDTSHFNFQILEFQSQMELSYRRGFAYYYKKKYLNTSFSGYNRGGANAGFQGGRGNVQSQSISQNIEIPLDPYGTVLFSNLHEKKHDSKTSPTGAVPGINHGKSASQSPTPTGGVAGKNPEKSAPMPPNKNLNDRLVL